MKQYILKLKTTSTTNYALYDGTTALTDAQLTTLFTTAGSAYFTFDFDSLTPSATNAITIVNSSDTAVVTNTNLTDTIVETKDFKGTWSASATAFDTFVALSGVAMDEAQLSDLMGKIKEAGGGRVIDVSDGDVLIGESNTGHIYSSDAGVYKIVNSGSASHKIKIGKQWSYDIPVGYSAAIILGCGPNKTGYGLLTGAGYDGVLYFSTSAASNKYKVLSTNTLTDNLNASMSGYTALDAHQGKVLNTSITNTSNKIGTLSNLTTTAKTSAVVAINEVNAKVLTNAGAPTTSTVGTVGQLLADTTNGKLYICTDATNPYVWEEVGAGGGGIQNALIIREWS